MRLYIALLAVLGSSLTFAGAARAFGERSLRIATACANTDGTQLNIVGGSAITQLDANGDGSVDAEEFASWHPGAPPLGHCTCTVPGSDPKVCTPNTGLYCDISMTAVGSSPCKHSPTKLTDPTVTHPSEFIIRNATLLGSSLNLKPWEWTLKYVNGRPQYACEGGGPLGGLHLTWHATKEWHVTKIDAPTQVLAKFLHDSATPEISSGRKAYDGTVWYCVTKRGSLLMKTWKLKEAQAAVGRDSDRNVTVIIIPMMVGSDTPPAGWTNNTEGDGNGGPRWRDPRDLEKNWQGGSMYWNGWHDINTARSVCSGENPPLGVPAKVYVLCIFPSVLKFAPML